MNGTLYFVRNCGCDASTYGLVRLNDDEFVKFKAFIENLNKNSYYDCMPRISVYRIEDESVLREFKYDPNTEPWDSNYVDPEKVFHLNRKTYTFVEEYFSYYTELELVIKGDRE